MSSTKHTLEQVLVGIAGSLGIKKVIAQKLNIHRNTVELYLRRWEAAREAYNEEVNTVGDMAESVIIRSIQHEEVETAKWYARMKLKDRGYVERQEISGPDSGPLFVKGYTVLANPDQWPDPPKKDTQGVGQQKDNATASS